MLWIDGASRNNPGLSSAAGIVKKENVRIAEWGIPLGVRTNNQAEYYALLFALLWLRKAKFTTASIHTDSQLMCEQMNGNWKVKHPSIVPLYLSAIELIQTIPEIQIIHIPRGLNKEVDKLANHALDKGEICDSHFRKLILNNFHI